MSAFKSFDRVIADESDNGDRIKAVEFDEEVYQVQKRLEKRITSPK